MLAGRSFMLSRWKSKWEEIFVGEDEETSLSLSAGGEPQFLTTSLCATSWAFEIL